MATSGHESESINVGGLKDTLQKYKTDISDKKYVKPSGGIPKTDLASAVQTSLGKADSSLQSHQTIKQDGITGATLNRFGTCSTAAATAAKTVAITSGTFSLEAGASVRVKFSNANTAGTPTLNVYNGSTATGAKNIFHKGSQITTGGNKALLAGVCDFVYDGTQYHLVGNYIDTNTWNAASSSQAGYVPQATKGKFLHSNASTGNLEWVNDNNTTYTPQKLGNGIGTCSTSSGTALAVSLTGYELVQNGIVAVTFENDVPANATLNINSKGAKPIYYKGAAITADTIKADDTVMFAYDGTNYVVTSLGGGGGTIVWPEFVTIQLTSTEGTSDPNLIGTTIVVTNNTTSESILSTTWQGTDIIAQIPDGVSYTITVGSISEYTIYENTKTGTAVSGRLTLAKFDYIANAVDLGLPSGTLWCTHNVGASSPEDLGLYFSWGNIVSHVQGDGYNFNSSEYQSTSGYNLTANFTSGNSVYDAARAIMGDQWRIPTKAECEELIANTDYVKATINNVVGMKFMKKTDNSIYIFFPAAGNAENGSYDQIGDRVAIWNNEYNSASMANCILVRNISTTAGAVALENFPRNRGISIRGVI